MAAILRWYLSLKFMALDAGLAVSISFLYHCGKAKQANRMATAKDLVENWIMLIRRTRPEGLQK